MPLVTHNTPSLVGGVSQQPSPMRLPEQCEAQENALGTVVEGLRKRPPTEHIGTLAGAPTGLGAYHTINRDASERYQVTVENKALRVFNLADGSTEKADGTQFTIYDINGDNAVFGAGGDFDYLATTAPQTDIEFLSIADYTIVINRAIQAKMASTISADRGFEALAFVKQGNYKTDYILKVDGTTVTYFTIDAGTAGNEAYIQTSHIATILYTWLTDSSPADPPTGSTATISGGILDSSTWDVALEGSTIWIKRDDGADFTIKVDDSVGSTVLVAIKDSVQSFTELPVVAPEGFHIKIDGLPDQGSAGSTAYFVGFETTEGGIASFGDGSWEERAAQGIEYKTDYATMPHILVRLSSGDFLWTALNGITLGGAIGTTAPFTALKWGEIEAGDTKSNPRPAWIAESDGTGGNLIRGISFFKDRLVVLAGESVGLSESGHYFNSFKTTVTAVLDSGRIEVIAAHTRVNLLNHAVALRENLVLFSEFTQFVLRGNNEGTLTPKNVSVTATSEYEATRSVKPAAAKRSIFFAGTRGANTNILELFDTSTNRPQFEAVDITGQAPSYVQGSTLTMVASPTEDCLVIRAGAAATLYVYKWMFNGGDRIQSAWSKFTLGGANAEIMDVDWVDQHLYLVVRRGTETSLERMDFEPFLTDTASDFRVHLDRRANESDCSSVTYDSAADETTFTLPYAVGTNATMEVVSRAVTGLNDPFNLFLSTEDFVDPGSAWSFNDDCTGEDNTHIAPDGTLTADSITSDTTEAFTDNIGQNVTVSPADNAPYTYSVHVKKEIEDNVHIIVFLLNVDGPTTTREHAAFNIDLESGSVTYFSQTTTGGPGYSQDNVTVETVGDYWRISYTLIDYEGDSNQCRMLIYPNPQGSGEPGRTIVLWGAQLVNALGPAPAYYDHPAGLQYTVNSATSNTVKAKGDLTVTPVWLGEQYTFKYTFSELHLQRTSTRGSRTPISSGSHRVRYCRMSYADTAYFTAKVTPVGTDGYTYIMTGPPLGAANNVLGRVNLDTGIFKFPVMARHDGVSISLENSSPLPSRFVTAEWESQFHSRVGVGAHFG